MEKCVYHFDMDSNFATFEKISLFKIIVLFLRKKFQVQKLIISNPLNKKRGKK